MYENKKVTWRCLSVGQQVEGWSQANTSHSAIATVAAMNPAFVTLMVFGTQETRVPSEETMFEVKMTEEEFHQKYQTAAVEIVRAVQQVLPRDFIGYHEMWNAWVSYDPYEMAAACKEHELKVIGHCTDVTPKHNLIDSSVVQDIGICAEYEKGGDRIWCHWSTKDLNYLLSRWERRRRTGKEHPDGL